MAGQGIDQPGPVRAQPEPWTNLPGGIVHTRWRPLASSRTISSVRHGIRFSARLSAAGALVWR